MRKPGVFGFVMGLFLSLLLLVPANAQGAGVHEAYKKVLAEWESAYNKAKSEGDTYGDLSFDFYDMSALGSVKAYYALYDIDGNGTPELILRKTTSYEDIIAYIFTMKDGKARNIFGYDDKGRPGEVPGSREGSSAILSNGLIDSTDGDYAIYGIADDGYSATKFASREPHDFPDGASLNEAKWRYYANKKQVEYDAYLRHLNTRGYTVGGENALASIDWVALH